MYEVCAIDRTSIRRTWCLVTQGGEVLFPWMRIGVGRIKGCFYVARERRTGRLRRCDGVYVGVGLELG